MATYKVLGQVMPTSGSLTVLYTAPVGSSSIASSVTVCNQGTSGLYRIAVQPGSASINPKHYIVYDAALNANDSIFLSIGLTLSSSDVVSVQFNNSSASFNLYGTEL